MNLLDWLLVVLVLAYALSGYWQGFVTGAFATAGLLLGGLFGVWIAPVALGDANPSLLVSLGALFIVILAASLGQALLQFTGAKIRDKITWQPARALDAVGGALLSAVAVLLVAWALGVAIAGARAQRRHPDGAQSAVLARVDETLPERQRRARRVQQRGRHQLLPPLPRAVRARADRRSRPRPEAAAHRPRRRGTPRPSVLKIRGTNECGSGVEGTGFVYGDDRVMTNAHVVAGVDDPEVISTTARSRPRSSTTTPTSTSRCWPPTTSACPSLPFNRRPAGRGRRGDPGIPPGRPLRRAARPDPRPSSGCVPRHLRRGAPFIREVFSLRGLVRPGNSGGPIVSSAGDVVGVVFAASVTDRDTGYALTADQVQRSATRGRPTTTRSHRRLRRLGRRAVSPCRAAPSGSPCPGGSPPRARAPASPSGRR